MNIIYVAWSSRTPSSSLISSDTHLHLLYIKLQVIPLIIKFRLIFTCPPPFPSQCKLAVHCLLGVTGLVKLAALEWYNGREGYVRPNCPCLVVAFDNGRAQIMRHELDDSEYVCWRIFEVFTPWFCFHTRVLVTTFTIRVRLIVRQDFAHP